MNRTQKKTLVLLLGILVGLGILLAVVSAVKRSSAQREAEEAAAQDAASVITETEAAYSSLTYDNGSATLSFHLDEAGKWVWSDDPEFPLDDSTIQSILTLLTNLKPQQTITEGDTLEAYGLDQPFATLTAAKPDGGTLTISLGNTTTDGNSYYMLMNEQESPVYIISNSLYTEMSKTIYDMCDLPELPQLTEENLQSVTVEGAASREAVSALPVTSSPLAAQVTVTVSSPVSSSVEVSLSMGRNRVLAAPSTVTDWRFSSVSWGSSGRSHMS